MIGLIALIVAFLDFRTGALLTVVVGFAQDLLRKADPDQSPYWLALVLIFFAATVAGAAFRGQHRFWRRRDWMDIRLPALLFMGVLLAQGFVSILRYRFPLMAFIGFAAYVGPPAALVLGYWLGQRHDLMRRLLFFYVLASAAMASGIFFHQAGYDWALLKPIGGGLRVYSLVHGAVNLPQGFFRVPEVAAWHCATAACATVLLATSKRRFGFSPYLFMGLTIYFLWATIATGRRKALGEIIVFVGLYGFLLVWVRGRVGRFGGIIVAAVLLGMWGLERVGLSGQEATITSMQDRNSAEQGKAYERLVRNIRDLPEVVKFNGPFGRGLGTLTQGGYHAGADVEWGVVNEGGLARVVGELGVIGGLAFLWLLYRFVGNLRRKLPALRSQTMAEASFVLGILGLLGANVVVFVSAHQIFGDPFVYLLLGLFAGFATVSLDVIAFTAAAREEVVARSTAPTSSADLVSGPRTPGDVSIGPSPASGLSA